MELIELPNKQPTLERQNAYENTSCVTVYNFSIEDYIKFDSTDNFTNTSKLIDTMFMNRWDLRKDFIYISGYKNTNRNIDMFTTPEDLFMVVNKSNLEHCDAKSNYESMLKVENINKNDTDIVLFCDEKTKNPVVLTNIIYEDEYIKHYECIQIAKTIDIGEEYTIHGIDYYVID
jgi:hypothetical protein